MNQKLRAEVVQRDDVTLVKLAGVIDEDNDLGTLAERIGPGMCAIDLGGIERINSCGVRDWVNWLGKVERTGAKSVLLECSPAIVAQINLVSNFSGGGVVKSFYAPYFCPSCDVEKVLLIETQEMIDQSGPKAPTCRCDECDGVMDFDDMDSYFSFVSAMKNRVLFYPKVDAMLSEMSPGDGDRKVRSRVGLSGTATGSGTGPNAGAGSSFPMSSSGGVGLAAAASNPGLPTPGLMRQSISARGQNSTGWGGTVPVPAPPGIGLPGVVQPGAAPAAGGGRNRIYGVAIVLFLIMAIFLFVYAFFVARPEKPAQLGKEPAAAYASNSDSHLDQSRRLA